MEKLKIGNRKSLDFGEQIGIPVERCKELAKMLDRIMHEASTGPARVVPLIDIIEAIHDNCATIEEYTWCLVNHLQWMHRGNRLLKPYHKN